MAASNTRFNSWHRSVRLATFVMILSATWVAVTRAQTKSGPYSLFQFATLTGSDNTITVTRVPVITASGNTIYKNVAIQFEVDADGNLTLTPEFPKVIDALPLLVSSFIAGNYVGPGTLLGGKATVIINGPGPTAGGAAAWSLTAAPDATQCTYPASATWYVGPIESNPLAARLRRESITSTAWSYGVTGASSCSSSISSSVSSTIDRFWRSGTLIGVSQTGNAVTIASFSEFGGDNSAPRDQITYRLVP